MASLEDAINKAVKVAKAKREERFIVFEPNEFDQPGNDYHIATEEDTETFYAGAPVLAYISSSGAVEYSEARQ